MTRRPPRVALLCFPVLAFLFSAPESDAQTFTRIITGPVAEDVARSGGCAWADINGDGHLDLFVAHGNVTPQNDALFISDRMGGFEKITEGPVVTSGGPSIGGTWGDYDNDGDPDLFVTNRTPTVNFLFRNLGGLNFERVMGVPAATNIADHNMSSWVDMNRDGWLDLFVVNFNDVKYVYINDGTGQLVRRTTGVEAMTPVSSIGCAWGDYDNDGDPDVFVANASGQPDDLFTNDGAGNFTKSSFEDNLSTLAGSWGDFDNDGDLDLFATNFLNQNNMLYVNDGPPGYTLTLMTTGAVVSDGGNSVGSAWGDIDNDGDLDLYVGNDAQVNFLYRNDGGELIRYNDGGDITAGVGNTFGVTLVDYDNDGDLDAMDALRTEGANRLFRNEGNANHWLRVAVRGTTSNRTGIGARLITSAVIGGSRVRQMREIQGQDGYNSQAGLIASFGFGDAAVVDTLIVRWPSGQVDEFHDLDTNVILTVTEGAPDIVPVTPVSFTAERVAEGVRVFWRVVDDVYGVGFDVYRQTTGGERIRIGAPDGSSSGSGYEFIDRLAPADVLDYWLRVTERGGDVRWYGPVSVAAVAPPVVPTLGPGLPNPFSDRVSFRVSIPRPSLVQAAIYDARGALVRVLERGERQAEELTVEWNGLDDGGVPVGPGVYWLRLEAGGGMITRKITKGR